MKLTKLFIVFLLCLVASFTAQAQYVEGDDTLSTPPQPRPEWRDRIIPGGNFGASFGNITFVQIAPLIGYRLTDRFSAGVGFNYIYMRVRDRFGVFSSSLYGPRSYGRFMITPNIFAQGEYEYLNVETFNSRGELVRMWNSVPLLGGGFVVPIGRRGGIAFTALYNLNHQPGLPPYGGSPFIIRTGFSF
jgi:hypothetical protein